MKVTRTLSPNYNERCEGQSPSALVLHYTGTLSAQEASQIYLDPSGGLSPHYMIDRDGQITQFVDEEKRAWHAGQSSWEGQEDLNSRSIGIEIVNGGHNHDLPSFPMQQIESLISLCQDIIKRYALDPFQILAHSDIAPGRKLDPGEHFPWAYLAENGVGHWPEPISEDFSCDLGVRTGLVRLGYSSECEDVVLVREFQRRFEPELFEKNKQGQVSNRTHALIACLLRMKEA